MSDSTVRILGKTYRVRMGDPDEHRDVCGKVMGDLILLNPDLAVDQMAETLLHEMIHVVSDELKLELTEEQVTRLSVGLWPALFIDNQHLAPLMGAQSKEIPCVSLFPV